MRGGEEAFGATLVGLSETAQLPQTQGLAVQGPAAALAHAQRCVAVLYAAFIFPLRNRDIMRVLRGKTIWLIMLASRHMYISGRKRSMHSLKLLDKQSVRTKFTHNVHTFIGSAFMDQVDFVQLRCLHVWNTYIVYIVHWIHRSISKVNQ